MSWYRQYRPTTISGLHLQSVRKQLDQLRTAKTFPHALLLTGPRGAGKTSTARIVAAMLNDPANAKGTPFQDPNVNDELVSRIVQGNSLSVHEMDAASHRGIDDIRALKEQAYLPPQEGSTLVFILDEVHMLTTEAFNALLKLLEEPPKHVAFILATTEEHKVPATIASRSTVIRFSKASLDELKDALQPIIEDQKLDIEADALNAVVEAADGSFRDAVKTLETVAAGVEKITLDHVQRYLKAVPAQVIADLLDSIINKREKDVVELFSALRSQNVDAKFFYQNLINTLHKDLVLSVVEPSSAKFSKRISQFLLAQFSLPEVTVSSPIPLLGIELKALELIFRAQGKNGGESAPTPQGPKTAGVATSQSSTKKAVASGAILHASSPTDTVVPDLSTEPSLSVAEQSFAETISYSPATTTPPSFEDADKVIQNQKPVEGDSALSMLLIEKWQEFLKAVEGRNSSIAALLRSGRASLSASGCVCVEVFYQFHRDQLKQPKFQTILEQACTSILGQAPRFEFQLAQSGKVAETLSSVTVPNGEADQLVQLAQEVFL